MWRRRKLWIILLAAPLVLLAADTLYWLIAVRNLEAGFTAWSNEQRRAGWSEVYGTLVRGGWPLAATLTVPAISLAGGTSSIPGGLAWSADSLVLRVALPRPSLLWIAPKGTQRLRFAGNPEIRFGADRMDVEVPLQPARVPPFLDVTTEHLRANTPLGDDAGVGSVRLRLDLRPEAQSGEPAVAFALRVAAMTLPSGMAHPLGPHIASLAVDGALNGPVPLGHTPAERATAWRDGGGSAEIRHLALVLGTARSHRQRDAGARRTIAADGRCERACARLCRDARLAGDTCRDKPIRRHRGQGGAVAAGEQPGRRQPSGCRGTAHAAVPHPVDAADTSGKAARDRVAVICDRCDRRVRSRNDYPEHHDAN